MQKGWARRVTLHPRAVTFMEFGSSVRRPGWQGLQVDSALVLPAWELACHTSLTGALQVSHHHWLSASAVAYRSWPPYRARNGHADGLFQLCGIDLSVRQVHDDLSRLSSRGARTMSRCLPFTHRYGSWRLTYASKWDPCESTRTCEICGHVSKVTHHDWVDSTRPTELGTVSDPKCSHCGMRKSGLPF
jgi:hypothetical protein